MEFLLLICDGLRAKGIAQRLGISPKTVEFHKSGIHQRLGIKETALLVRYAIWPDRAVKEGYSSVPFLDDVGDDEIASIAEIKTRVENGFLRTGTHPATFTGVMSYPVISTHAVRGESLATLRSSSVPVISGIAKSDTTK
jgi:hypothetical protein